MAENKNTPMSMAELSKGGFQGGFPDTTVPLFSELALNTLNYYNQIQQPSNKTAQLLLAEALASNWNCCRRGLKIGGNLLHLSKFRNYLLCPGSPLNLPPMNTHPRTKKLAKQQKLLSKSSRVQSPQTKLECSQSESDDSGSLSSKEQSEREHQSKNSKDSSKTEEARDFGQMLLEKLIQDSKASKRKANSAKVIIEIIDSDNEVHWDSGQSQEEWMQSQPEKLEQIDYSLEKKAIHKGVLEDEPSAQIDRMFSENHKHEKMRSKASRKKKIERYEEERNQNADEQALEELLNSEINRKSQTKVHGHELYQNIEVSDRQRYFRKLTKNYVRALQAIREEIDEKQRLKPSEVATKGSKSKSKKIVKFNSFIFYKQFKDEDEPKNITVAEQRKEVVRQQGEGLEE